MYMIQDIGIPFEMHVDGAKEENLGQWEEVRKACLIKQTQTEPYSPYPQSARGLPLERGPALHRKYSLQ